MRASPYLIEILALNLRPGTDEFLLPGHVFCVDFFLQRVDDGLGSRRRIGGRLSLSERHDHCDGSDQIDPYKNVEKSVEAFQIHGHENGHGK